MTTVESTVTVPAEFFRGELRVYSDWREAFARELLQNATDANPSRIEVSFGTTEDGHGRVTFSDDGHGMSRQVLEEVFFALGRTTKTGPDSIGGFGRARIIICFAQHRYTIHTGNLRVDGHGGSYTITETDETVRGTRFVIDLLDEDCDRVRRAFMYLLNQCSIAVPVFVDGVEHAPRAMPSRAARVMRDADKRAWGKVYVSSDGYYGQLLVRVHGLVMFRRWLDVSDTVILELDPARSREVLSASRDQVHGDFGRDLDEFIAALSKNRRQALRPEQEPLNVHVGGGGFLATDAEKPDTGDDTDTFSSEGGGADPEHTGAQDGESVARTTVAVTPANEAAFTNMAAAAGQGLLDLGLGAIPEPDVPSLGFDVYLMADSSDARVRRLARAWDPTGWDARTGRRRRAVLLAWKAAVGYAIELLVANHRELGRVLWTVGWTFDTDVNALHRSVGEGHVLALNPVDGTGRSRFHVSERTDRQVILARALHEAAHVAVGDHDEQFAGVLTELFASVDPAVADRRIRDAAGTA